MTEIKRKSIDIGIFGNKSYGKTLTMTALAFFYWLNGYIIFSNYLVGFPHVLIDEILGLKRVGEYSQDIKKLLIMEDFERWVHSRNAATKTNIDVNTICMDNGKNNASLIYTSKRPMAIDIGLRDTTDYFIETKMIMPFKPNTGNKKLDDIIISIWAEKFEMLWVKISAFDSSSKPLPVQYLTNLPFWGGLYNTQEKVPDIKIER